MASYDRNNPSYPYKSHAQWLKASFGLVSCIILILFNGIGAFLETPFNAREFIAAYIGVSPLRPFIPFCADLHRRLTCLAHSCRCSHSSSLDTRSAIMASDFRNGAQRGLMTLATLSKSRRKSAREGLNFPTPGRARQMPLPLPNGSGPGRSNVNTKSGGFG